MHVGSERRVERERSNPKRCASAALPSVLSTPLIAVSSAPLRERELERESVCEREKEREK